jgi:hypothetical protein
MSTLTRDPHTGYLTDPHILYAFVPLGGPSRTFTGEGTRVMLQNAHPDAQIVKCDVQPERPVATTNPFADPVVIDEAILEAMDESAPTTTMAEFLAGLNLAQVKTVAQRIGVEGRSKMNKAQLIEACDRGQTNTLAGFRSIFGIEV